MLRLCLVTHSQDLHVDMGHLCRTRVYTEEDMGRWMASTGCVALPSLGVEARMLPGSCSPGLNEWTWDWPKSPSQGSHISVSSPCFTRPDPSHDLDQCSCLCPGPLAPALPPPPPTVSTGYL